MERVYLTWKNPGSFRYVRQAPAIVVKRYTTRAYVRVYHPEEHCYQFLTVKMERVIPREECIEEADRP